MQVVLKRGSLFLLMVLTLIMTGCASTAYEETLTYDNGTVHQSYAPIATYVDLTEDFRESKNEPFDEHLRKEELTCAKEGSAAYVQSEDSVMLDRVEKLKVYCAWDPQDRYVYIGLKNVETGCCYLLPSVGGVVCGTIDLTGIPDGEYHVIMFSDDNPSVIAAMLYQLES